MNQIEKVYPYFNAGSELLFEVVRFARDPDGKKSFGQRRPDGRGGWIWNLDGVREKPLYHLHEILSNPTWPVVIVEGEKDVETLEELGLVATTNPGGAGKWQPEHSQRLRGRRCVIIPDQDQPGLNHATLVAGSLLVWGAASIRVCQLTATLGADVTDWLMDVKPDQRKALLLERIKATPEWVLSNPNKAA